MSSLLSTISTISGNFSKSLIMGMFAPAALFVILSLLLINPLLPGTPVLNPVTAIDNGWPLVAIALITIILSLGLYSLNGHLIRSYEGYPWQNFWVGRIKKDYYRRKADQYQAQWEHIRSLINRMDPPDPDKMKPLDDAEKKRVIDNWLATTAPADLKKRMKEMPGTGKERVDYAWTVLVNQVETEYQIAELKRLQFPDNSDLILPTRFGNTVRKFEEYPHLEYQIDAVTFWPRLISTIDPSISSSIDDAKSGVDLLLNSSALSWLLAIILFFVGLFTPVMAGSWLMYIRWISSIILLLAVGYLCYLASLYGAKQWGDLIMSAFDIYRLEMLKKLGFERDFKNREEEKAFWQAVSQQTIYHRSTNFPEYSVQANPTPSTTTSAVSKTLKINLPYERRTSRQLLTGRIRVTVRIANETHQVIQDITFTDTLPDCRSYVPGSAYASQGSLTLEDTGPLVFSVDHTTLAPGKSLKIHYWMQEKITP